MLEADLKAVLAAANDRIACTNEQTETQATCFEALKPRTRYRAALNVESITPILHAQAGEVGKAPAKDTRESRHDCDILRGETANPEARACESHTPPPMVGATYARADEERESTPIKAGVLCLGETPVCHGQLEQQGNDGCGSRDYSHSSKSSG